MTNHRRHKTANGLRMERILAAACKVPTQLCMLVAPCALPNEGGASEYRDLSDEARRGRAEPPSRLWPSAARLFRPREASDKFREIRTLLRAQNGEPRLTQAVCRG